MNEPNRPDRRDSEGDDRPGGQGRAGRSGPPRPRGSAAGRPDRSGAGRRGPRPTGSGDRTRDDRGRDDRTRDDRTRDDRTRDDRTRDDRTRDDRSRDDRSRSRDDRSQGRDDRSQGRDERRGGWSERPASGDRRTDRPQGDRSQGDRSQGGRLQGDRPQSAARRPTTGRPAERGARGTREPRPWDDRGGRPGADGGRRGGDDRSRPAGGSRTSAPSGGARGGYDQRTGRPGEERRPRGGVGRNEEPPRPGLARKANEPPVPEGVDTRELHRSARAELRGLPKDLAEIVAAHLVVAGQLIEDDPELAYAHAEAARRRAARLPLVREAAAETAYASGRWDVALSEYRALRRMTGTDDYLPVMADCERALGRPENALKLAREAERLTLDPALRIEMTIVESGARRDLGQGAEALRLLHHAVETQTPTAALRGPSARLRYAYAEALLESGDETGARRWFATAAKLDPEGDLDAQERVDALDGMLIQFDEDDDEDQVEPAADETGRTGADGAGHRQDRSS